MYANFRHFDIFGAYDFDGLTGGIPAADYDLSAIPFLQPSKSGLTITPVAESPQDTTLYMNPPAAFELSSLLAVNGGDGSSGFVINGIDNFDNSGISVSSAGDINGDGLDDIIIGANRADPNGESSGESYVVFGQAGGFGASFDLSTLNGTNGFAINGIDVDDRSGSPVSSAGDINGDGFDDIIIGAYRGDPNGNSDAGESYVVFGQASGFGSSFDLSTLNGSNGFTVNGLDTNDISGISVASAGDMNGDGFDDILIGAVGADPNDQGSGESYVVFGQASGFGASFDLSTLDGSNGFVINGIRLEDNSGRSVSSAGDINGDGFDDILIGAPYAEPHAYTYGSYYGTEYGATYVVFGQASGFSPSLELSALDGSNGFVIRGANEGDISGHSVSSAGDINGDGFDDILIGAYRANSYGNDDNGHSYVVFGQAGGFGSELNLLSLNGTNGFVIYGIDDRDNSGFSVSSAGDVNGDGFDDILIGAPLGDPNGPNSGETYLIFGTDAPFAASLNLSSLDGLNGLVINGVGLGNVSGRSVSAAGDINGDGFDDIIIGAPFADPNGDSDAGQSFVIYGRADFGSQGLDPTLGNDDLTGTPGEDTIDLLAGDDIYHGLDGADTILGGAGEDTLYGEGGRDRLEGGDGRDTMFGGDDTDFMLGGSDRDTMFGGDQSDRMFGQDGNDIMNGGGSNDIMHGGGNADIMYGGLGNDNMNGGSNVDRLFGQENNDTLYGGNAGDQIDGGSGNDILWGGNRGSGADGFGDTFIFANNFGTDVIMDFEDGLDVIDFSGHTGINDFAEVLNRASEDGTSLLIATNANNTLIIENFTLAELDASDFVF